MATGPSARRNHLDDSEQPRPWPVDRPRGGAGRRQPDI